jgi:hypothetical protein
VDRPAATGRTVLRPLRWLGNQVDSLHSEYECAQVNFVITADKPFTTTNLTAKVSFTRVVLEGGKLADVGKDVSVTGVEK